MRSRVKISGVLFRILGVSENYPLKLAAQKSGPSIHVNTPLFPQSSCEIFFSDNVTRGHPDPVGGCMLLVLVVCWWYHDVDMTGMVVACWWVWYVGYGGGSMLVVVVCWVWWWYGYAWYVGM